MNPKDFYETMYAQYREPAPLGRFARISKQLELDREEVASKLLDGGERFLDVGCGEGRLVFLEAQKFDEVYGIDISYARVCRAQKIGHEIAGGRIHFLVVDVSRGLPFNDACFDAVSCVATLEHIFNPEELLNELYRVLRPGKVLVVVAPNIAYLPRRISALLGRPPRTSSAAGYMDGGTLHYFTLNSLISLLQQRGFSIIGKSNAGKFWFLRNWWKSLLASGLAIKVIKTDKVPKSKQVEPRTLIL